jgi:hypothetical protein
MNKEQGARKQAVNPATSTTSWTLGDLTRVSVDSVNITDGNGSGLITIYTDFDHYFTLDRGGPSTSWNNAFDVLFQDGAGSSTAGGYGVAYTSSAHSTMFGPPGATSHTLAIGLSVVGGQMAVTPTVDGSAVWFSKSPSSYDMVSSYTFSNWSPTSTVYVALGESMHSGGTVTAVVDNFQIEGVPEPGTLALLAAGLAGLLCYAWRKRR